jgi:serine/threonine protein kinase
MLEKGKKVGEYVLLEKLGAGSFGEVWKAEKRTEFSTSYFALKFFRPKEDDEIDVTAVKREVGTWQSLNGLPNVISVIEANRFENYVYIVSEFAEGGSLDKWLKANGGKAGSIEDAVKIVLQILQGLEGMHSEGFVHRDLKPANVLLKRNIFYLADFGISRQMKTHSKTNSTAGTYEFMPPEAFEKNPSVSVHTDIWAVGAILQKLLTGNLPFPQDEIPSLMAAILMSEPEPLPETVPSALKEIVRKALQKEREDRFHSASAMREALQNSQKFLESQKSRQSETLVWGDLDKTEKYEISPTKDWREIEAKEESLESLQRLKRIENTRYFQELDSKRRQVLNERTERDFKEKQSRKARKIRVTIVGAVFLAILITGVVLISLKPNNSAFLTKSTNTNLKQFTNNELNLPANAATTVQVSNSTNRLVNSNSLALNSNSNNATPFITTAIVTVWMRSCGDGCNPAKGDADWSNGTVILKTAKGEFKSKTNGSGRASFSNVPCGKVIITFEPAYFGEKYNRVVPCNKPQVDLGKFMVGEPAV